MILAIDPGTTQSAYVVWDGETISEFGLLENGELKDLFIWVSALCQTAVIEQVKSYGMPVGESIFETVYWSGRFTEALENWGVAVNRIPRLDVKMHLCHTTRAKDSNITQALVDRFAPGVRNKGKGIKADPGFFYGFRRDVWQAFAVAVTYHDLNAN